VPAIIRFDGPLFLRLAYNRRTMPLDADRAAWKLSSSVAATWQHLEDMLLFVANALLQKLGMIFPLSFTDCPMPRTKGYLRTQLLAPHLLAPHVLVPLGPPLHRDGSASEANLHAFLQHLMSPLLPLHLMAHLSASKHRSLLSILTVIMATKPLDDPTPLSFNNLIKGDSKRVEVARRD